MADINVKKVDQTLATTLIKIFEVKVEDRWYNDLMIFK